MRGLHFGVFSFSLGVVALCAVLIALEKLRGIAVRA